MYMHTVATFNLHTYMIPGGPWVPGTVFYFGNTAATTAPPTPAATAYLPIFFFFFS